MKWRARRAIATWLACAGAAIATGVVAADAPAPAADAAPTAAQLFGRREFVEGISLSPDGNSVVFVTPGKANGTVVAVMRLDDGVIRGVGTADGKPLNLVGCGWTSNTRVACREYGVSFDAGMQMPFSRTFAIDADGKRFAYLGRPTSVDSTRGSQFDGEIVDWGGGDGTVLMTRDYVPNAQTGTHFTQLDGIGVDRVDTATGRGRTVESPDGRADFITDGQGNVRIRVKEEAGEAGILTGVTDYSYRTKDSRAWKAFSRVKLGQDGLVPIAVDGTRDTAYAVKTLNGRDALFAVALDGSMKTDLVFSHPDVDVHGVVTIGRHGRVIGATYQTDRRQVEYFDPEYKKLEASLIRALSKTPIIEFVSANADESQLLVYAASDVDPGHYYRYTKANHHLEEVLLARPAMEKVALAPMKAITYKAADGTVIPAYLTLPPSGSGAKNLPAIVMPHGGPDYRDSWGFDWLVQFFAQAGYAVLQPEYRGSSGYGDAFYAHNGFHSWQTAIGDVCDGGRWLVKEGIAAPDKLAIVGWSYGGYAALQANVLDPKLFKAVVAVAPVTDLGMVKAEARDFTNSDIVAKQIGSGEIVSAGSPARHADRFQAPVLMFHGDHDLNVGVAESRAMDSALRHAGKQSTLVVFPGLDHQLDDADARATLLGRADQFLRASMKLGG